MQSKVMSSDITHIFALNLTSVHPVSVFKEPLKYEAIQIMEKGRKILEKHLEAFIPKGNQLE